MQASQVLPASPSRPMPQTSPDVSRRPAAPPPLPRRLGASLLKLFTQEAAVTGVEVLSPHFRRLTLQAPAFRATAWVPGQKLQVPIGGLSTRTYTPMTWDRERGATQLLGYLHGEGPGTAWLCGVLPGDRCQVFGPRASLDVADAPGPVLLVGDETSFALAHALRTAPQGQDLRLLLEVSSAQESLQVLYALGIDDAVLVEREPGDAHLPALEAALLRLAAQAQAQQAHAPARFVLSGRAGAIQLLSRALRRQGVPPSQLRAKAYWAPGKRGLD